MFQFCTLLTTFLSCCVLSSSQEPILQLFNESTFYNRENSRIPVEYGELEPELWLISKDDPIPMSLNRQWPIDEAIQRRIIDIGPNDYRSSVTESRNLEGRSVPQQTFAPYISSAPVRNNDRVVTGENQRQNVDESRFNVQSPNAVLVQLPVHVTSGLWERPQRQVLEQLFMKEMQNSNSQTVNINLDRVINNERQVEVPFVYTPIRQVGSRLSVNAEQKQSDIPVEQYYEEPHRNLPRVTDISDVGNVSSVTNPLNYLFPESRAESILVADNGQNAQTESKDELFGKEYEVPATDRTYRKVHEFGAVLTSEDIELLERLGILSSLVIEPMESENSTSKFYPEENSGREYETQLEVIDNGGQSYSINSENVANLTDVILFSVPQFTAAQYHSNLPENAGSDRSFRPSYSVPQTDNESEVSIKENSTSNIQNETNFNDRQILEFLQILSVNPGDVFNFVSQRPPTSEAKNGESERNGNVTLNSTEYHIPNISLKNELNVNTETTQRIEVAPPPATATKSNNISLNTTAEPTSFTSLPTVKNGRIQPRLLEKLTVKENEIIEKLMEKAIPMSESKLDVLKKFQIRPKPYFFGFRQDDGNGTLQHRNETSDASGMVKGNYGYRDATGVYRNVSYIADDKGFHAVVKTNEPGTVSHNTADVVFMAETPPLSALIKMMAYKRPRVERNDTAKP